MPALATESTKPGMPTVFGRSGSCFCFGLPGNPVSTFVLFETLVKTESLTIEPSGGEAAKLLIDQGQQFVRGA